MASSPSLLRGSRGRRGRRESVDGLTPSTTASSRWLSPRRSAARSRARVSTTSDATDPPGCSRGASFQLKGYGTIVSIASPTGAYPFDSMLEEEVVLHEVEPGQ